MKGNYAFPKVQEALQFRYDSLTHPQWVGAISYLITKQEKSGHFRWHDSGDIQDLDHLRRIIEVAELTPHIQHWLPTREYRLIDAFVNAGGLFPENLVVRVSAHFLDKLAPKKFAVTSSVQKESTVVGYKCPAPTQGNQCGDCRACWQPSISNVTYHVH